MDQLKQAFENAKLYDRYVYTKMYAQGNLLWGYIGLFGTIVTYFILVIADALKIDENYVGAGIGMLWIALSSVGILFAFNPRPEERVELSKKPETPNFLWPMWILGFLIGALVEIPAQNAGLVETHAILAVSVALFIGNSANAVVVREKLSYLIPILILLSIIGILIVPYPYEMLIFGIGIWIPYYIVGFKLYRIDMPKMLKG